MSDSAVEIAVLKTRVDAVEKVLPTKVSNETFDPVRKIVFGMVGLILVAVGSAIVKAILSEAPKLVGG